MLTSNVIPECQQGIDTIEQNMHLPSLDNHTKISISIRSASQIIPGKLISTCHF